MAEPFTATQLRKENFFNRLFKTKPKKNAILEINNQFAESSNLKDVTVEAVQGIAGNYKIKNLNKTFKSELEEFYSTYLKHCLADKVMTDEEVSRLAHLKFILELDDTTVDKIYNEITTLIYKESVDNAIIDGKVSQEEKDFLGKLKQNLRLPDEITQKIYDSQAQNFLTRHVESAVADERLSPEEEKDFEAIAQNLGVEIKYEEKTKNILDKFRLYWLIENGKIPEVQADINLQRNEKCYFKTYINWNENRKVTRRISYGGPTLRIKIAKGIYWRAGSVSVQRYSEDVLTRIDSGNIYLTNKRLIFTGNRKNSTIQLLKILDFEVFKNGVEIQKESSKNPILEFENNVDVFAMILGQAIKNLD